MKRSPALIPAVLLSGALAGPALAQVGTAPSGMASPANETAHPQRYEKRHPYAHHFAEFLKNHPGIDGDLSRDPALVHDKAYMKAHPELEQYLEKHQGVAEELRSHPAQFMKRVHRAQGSEGRGPY